MFAWFIVYFILALTFLSQNSAKLLSHIFYLRVIYNSLENLR